MSARVRGAALACGLAVAIIGVMVALDSHHGAPGDIGNTLHGPASAAGGSADAGADVWPRDTAAASTEEAGPEPSAAQGPKTRGVHEEPESESDPHGPVVELASSPEGPLYVTGAGIDGLTPQRTLPLGLGPHRLRLVGGRGAPPVVVILNSQPPRLDATLSGEETEPLHVTCRGGISAPEPVTTAVGARLVCWVRGPSGTLTVELRVVGR